jgi:hypothetical protein
MKDKEIECIGNCRCCSFLGVCPSDVVRCEDCGQELEEGEGIEIEVEVVHLKKHSSKMITVCESCYSTLYQSEESNEEYL